MSYCSADKKKVKSLAEVFTPAGVVFQMCLQKDIRPAVMDVDKTILDPAVGQGQFPCAELVLKLFFNVDKLNEEIALRALKSLYGVDIQPASVDKTREHLIATLIDSYKYFTGKDFILLDDAKTIVDENIIAGDFLKLAKQWTNHNYPYFEGDTMQPIIGKIEQLTTRPSPPSGGSGVKTPPSFDLSKLDEAQQKADKLKATLLEIQELSKTILDEFSSIHEKTFEKFWDYHSKRHEEIKHEIEANQERIRSWRS